ncbi:protein PAXX-like [Anneissia japonica]|uniref:protein PAXX-like n=1 Tax=Anneissia japonica TaxID=1529436 RepID=UPI00142594A1|nr:protein PAXX-like [Anneissia japonica]
MNIHFVCKLSKMESAKDIAEANKASNLQSTIVSEGVKYLCFTTTTQSDWVFHVTNGIELWQQNFDLSKLGSHRDDSGFSNYEEYFSQLKAAYDLNKLTVTKQQPEVVLVTIGNGTKCLCYELTEATVSKRKSDLRDILFYLAAGMEKLEQEITDLKKEREKMKKQGYSSKIFPDGSGYQVPDLDTKRVAPLNKPPKDPGRSLVNPNSKRRKLPKGVEFD